MKEIKTQTKEEFVKTKNGMKIQTITLPGKNVNNPSEKHLVYFIGGNKALSPSKDYSQNWDWATEQGISGALQDVTLSPRKEENRLQRAPG